MRKGDENMLLIFIKCLFYLFPFILIIVLSSMHFRALCWCCCCCFHFLFSPLRNFSTFCANNTHNLFHCAFHLFIRSFIKRCGRMENVHWALNGIYSYVCALLVEGEGSQTGSMRFIIYHPCVSCVRETWEGYSHWFLPFFDLNSVHRSPRKVHRYK